MKDEIMATIIKSVPVEFFHFKSKEEVENLLKFADCGHCSYGRGKWFYVYDGSVILFHLAIGDYVAKIGDKFTVLTEEEFESL